MKALLWLLVACASPAAQPEDVLTIGSQTLLAISGKFIYGAEGDGTLWRYDKTSNERVNLAHLEVGPDDLVVIDDAVYYTLPVQGALDDTLYRLGGGVVASHVERGSVRVDGALWWRSGGIVRDGTQLVPTSEGNDLALDATHVYWFDQQAPGVIKRTAKQGGVVEALVGGVTGHQLQVSGELVFFIDHGVLSSAPKTGGAVRATIAAPSRFWALGNTIVYSIYDSRYGPEQALWRMQPDGTHRTSLVFDLGTAAPISLIQDGKRVYWTNGAHLVRLSLQ